MADGWKGANIAPSFPVSAGGRLGDAYRCNLCGVIHPANREGKVRMFHGGARPSDNTHLAVCEECAKKLPNFWHGCGCGG